MNLFRFIKRLTIISIALFLCYASAGALQLPVKNVKKKECYYYKVKEGESIYDVADLLGLTKSEIVKYNSSAGDGVKKGMTLYFPVEDFGADHEFGSAVADLESEVPADSLDVAEVIEEPREFRVAVCMPFMLSQEKIEKQGEYATDFYRGFLLGVDSLRAYYNNPLLHITAIDCFSPESLAIPANLDALNDADIIVAPEAQAQLSELEKIGLASQTYVFNVFQSRDNSQNTNPFVLQGNIPSNKMYEKAVNRYIEELNGATPVILDNTTGKRDKQQFIDALTLKLDEAGIEYITIKHEGTLTLSSLSNQLPETPHDYVFISSGGSLADFQKFATALVSMKTAYEENPEINNTIRLFGYPEYTRFTNDAYNKLKKLGTTFYSRFYNDPQSASTEMINRSFAKRYGTSLPEGVPNQVLYGFDVAHWIIALSAKGEITRDSIGETITDEVAQSGYIFESVEDGGFVNDSLLFVTLYPEDPTRIEVL